MADNSITPTRSGSAPILQSTSQMAKATSSSSYLSGSLTVARDALVQNIGCSPVPIDALLCTLFPLVEFKVVEAVGSSLTTAGKLSERGWTAFKATCGKHGGVYEPKNSRSDKVETFKALETVFSDIFESAAPNAQPVVCLSMHGRRYSETSTPNSARPDGSIYLTTTSLPWPRRAGALVLDYADIGLIIEVKKKSNVESTKDNEKKILWAAQHKLRCDPRCRFVTGITIENTTAHLWYFDRAGVLRSDSFNFMKEPRTLIHFFLGFILAKDEVTIGFDTSIRCKGPPQCPSVNGKQNSVADQERQYEIDVQGSLTSKPTSFRTTKCIDQHATASICGRGTRVWEVTMIGDPETDRRYVLKDVWIDEGRVDEGTILNDLHKPTDGVPVGEPAQPVNDSHGSTSEDPQYFLTSKCHGSVFVTGADGVEREDTTIKLSVKVAPPVAIQLPPEDDLHRSAKASKGTYDTYENGPPVPPPKWGSRKHFRIVFEEPPGRPITQLKTHLEAFKALRGGLEAMRDMLRKGFIHRDISAGNILLMEFGGVLIDLEYAKRFPGDQSKHHAVRTGTKQFMAVEVVSLNYLFKPRPNAKTIHETGKFPWSHNPLHDLESAWWIAIWIAFTFPGTDLNDIETHLRDELFSEAKQTTREHFFMLTNVRYDLPHALPDSLRFHLELWRQQLYEAYTEAEKDLQDGSHLTFDYDESFAYAIDIVDKIRTTLVERPHDGIAAPTGESG